MRWLSLLTSIERLIIVYPVVKSYFLNLEHNECPNLLLEFFTSNEGSYFYLETDQSISLPFHTGECSLYFLTNILPEVQAANLALQRKSTTGVNLHSIITNLLNKLNNRLQDDFFGCKVGQLLKDVQSSSSSKVEDLNKSFRSFIRTVIDYIEKYYSSSASLYRSISIFSEVNIEKIEWKNIKHCCTFIDDNMIDQDGLYNDFNHINSKYIALREKYGGIVDQVQSFISLNLDLSNGVRVTLCDDDDSVLDDDECYATDDSDSNDDDERNAKCHKQQNESLSIRCDHLWAYLLNDEAVPDLKKLIQYVFAIPASNAYCETVFSHMKYLWNNNRNRMKQELVGAELKIKMNTNYNCTQFYDYLLNKPDILQEIRSPSKYSHIAKIPRTI